ncbi:MAG: hypothetical protein P4L50_00215 [Anaerolineaceae bacterium]|nr:hypothetical protein [Anaerolineaceae bacterium]
MASQVPYSGTQEITPQVNPLSTAHVDTPVAAFGGAVAGAITHMGEVAQGAGKELFDRAYAMQDLAEHNKADMASTEYSGKATELYLQLDTLKGQDRIDAIPKFKQDLEATRQDTMAKYGVKSPVAIQQYNDYTRRIFTGMDWHASVLARAGLDEATQAAALSGMQAAADRFVKVGSFSGKDFDDAVNDIRTKAGIYAYEVKQLKPGTPGYIDEVNQTSSKYASKMLIGISNSDPVYGQKSLEAAKQSGLITTEDYDLLKDRFENAVTNKLGRKLGVEAVTSNPDASTREKLTAAKAAAAKADPGNANLADTANMAAEERIGHEQMAKEHADRDDTATLFGIVDGTATGGKVPLSLDEAMQNPDFKSRYLNLDTSTQLKIWGKIQENNKTDGWVPNANGTAQRNELYNIAHGLNNPTPADLDKLLNWDFTQDSMTMTQRNEVRSWQSEVMKQQGSIGNVRQLVQSPRVQMVMRDNNITKDNPDQYNQFLAAFGEAVQDYEAGAHRTVKGMDELGEIAQALVYRQAKSHWWSSQNPAMFEFEDRNVFKDMVVDNWKAAHNGADPTDQDLDDLRATLYREKFQTLGAKSAPPQSKFDVKATP